MPKSFMSRARRVFTAAMTLAILASGVLMSSATAEECSNGVFRIDSRFEGGDFDECRFRRDDAVIITLYPEDAGVDSMFSWFALRVRSQEPRALRIKLRFPDAYARYWPKISDDGRLWRPIDPENAKRSWRGKSMSLVVTADADGTWVAAQELLTLPYYYQWIAGLDAREAISTRVIGESVQGRPLHLAASDRRPEAIVLLGRQHPAEVPGALAMRVFVDTVLADTPLARAFSDRFMLLIVPLMNPDGVVKGHSRHNAASTDLNRDWGPFQQPETRSVAKLLADLEDDGTRPKLMLDFHATKETASMIFYTQLPSDDTHPALFATHWMTRVRRRLPDYAFTHDPRAAIDQANTKNYFFRRYGIPAITYEIGDEAERSGIEQHTPVFAEEMMKVMLESK